MTRRRAARFGAVQALYQIEMSGAGPEMVIREFEDHRLKDLLEPLELEDWPPRVDREWFADVTRGAWRMAPELDPRIEATLATGWSLGRAGYLLRAFLRAGAFELAAQRDVPAGVVVNEYVALAHAFLSSEEAGFVNAVLDRLAGELRPEAPSPPGDALKAPTVEGEFDFIAHRLRPFATAPGALGLVDDAALLDPHPGTQLVLTKDAMIAGVHFLHDDPPDLIARKLLRVNLSDLAAMGAAALGYLLALARPETIEDGWLAAFCAGLAEDNAAFGISLLGGDTVLTPGPLTLSLTAIGELPNGEALLRSGARDGDDIWVSGTLGDAALGLAVLQGKLDVGEPVRAHLVERYRLPRPRLALGQALRGIAHAAIDISDGLLADLGHIVETSDLGAEIRADLLPFSAADLPGAQDAALSGGDDYELLFTTPPSKRDVVEDLAKKLDLPLTRIGGMQATSGIRVVDAAGAEIHPARTGWQHF